MLYSFFLSGARARISLRAGLVVAPWLQIETEGTAGLFVVLALALARFWRKEHVNAGAKTGYTQ